MHALNIYAADATIRKDIPEAEIAKLSKEQSDAFFAVMSSYSDTTEADAALIECEKATRRAISDLKRKMELHEKIVPARAFYDEWKRTVANLPEPEIDPEITKKLAASMKSLDKANALIPECQRDEELAKQVRKAAPLLHQETTMLDINPVPKIITFDCYGTLVQWREVLVRELAYMLREAGRK
jgi:hypothetical protein